MFSSPAIYAILATFEQNCNARAELAHSRAKYLVSRSITKVAFDTRRINQHTEINPRRNLQYYQRSQAYMDDKTARQVELFLKIKTAADELQQEFLGEPEWFNSQTRILCNAINQTLRIEQQDFDYSPAQFNYLSELLYVRYRISEDMLNSMSKNAIKQVLLNKDERLVRRSIFINYKDIKRGTK